MKMLIKSEKDSLIYINTLQALHDKDKLNPNYQELIIQYYSKTGQDDKLSAFVDKELEIKKYDKKLWALKGERYMQNHEWDKAIEAFSNAIAIDTLFVPAIYNIGICFSSKAILLRESADCKLKEATKSLLTKGASYLEHVQKLDPERRVVDWILPLYHIYIALNDKRAENIKKKIKH